MEEVYECSIAIKIANRLELISRLINVSLKILACSISIAGDTIKLSNLIYNLRNRAINLLNKLLHFFLILTLFVEEDVIAI